MKIDTEQFKLALKKVNACASNNNFIPLSSMLNLLAEDGYLTLHTTDGVNYADYKIKCDEDVSFDKVVDINTISKLIYKITTEFITISADKTNLTIKGNGTYKLPILLNGEGNQIQFPRPIQNFKYSVEPLLVNIDEINFIKKINKVSIDKTTQIKELLNYCFCGDGVITTDNVKLSFYKTNTWNFDILLSLKLFDLINLFDENFKLIVENNKLFAFNDNLQILGDVSSIEKFPKNESVSFCELSLPNSILVDKNLLLEAIDRISIFCNSTLFLKFEHNKLLVLDKDKNNYEVIEYNNTKGDEFECNIIFKLFVDSLKATTSDLITLEYGSDTFIKIKDTNITHINPLVIQDV